MTANPDILRSIAAAAAAGAAWTGLCLVLSWPLVGIAGVTVGAASGASVYLLHRDRVDAGDAFAAIAVTLLLLLAGGGWQASTARADARAAIAAEESLLLAVAEEILWERFSEAAEPAAEQQSLHGEAALTDGTTVPGFASVEEVPPPLLTAARERWQTMPTEEKQQLLHDRARFIESSYGSDLEHWETPATATGWLAIGSLATVAALLFSAWPLITARYFGWGK